MAKRSGKKSFLDYFRVDSDDDYEDEYDDMDEEEIFDDEEEEEYVKPKKAKKIKEKKKGSSAFSLNQDDNDYDAEQDSAFSSTDYSGSSYNSSGYTSTFGNDTYTKPSSSYQQKDTSFGSTRKYNRFTREDMQMNREAKEQNVVSFDKRQNYKPNSEVYVIKPVEFDDAQTVSDFLKAGKTIVINMEGVQIDPAQRIIDFICGA